MLRSGSRHIICWQRELNVDKLIKLKKSIVETSAKITHQRLEVKDHVYVGM